jgi:ornithine--oxo-acid transaminase
MGFIQIEEQLGAHNYKPLDVIISRGERVWVWDTDGRKYLDCLAAYSAVNQGHCHPRIMKALVEQASKLTLTSRAFRNDKLAVLYQTIREYIHYHKILPMNSGSEAVESAIKAVRKWGYEIKGVPPDRAEVIVCENNFHGRTISIISFSTDPAARSGFGPYTPGFKVIPYGDSKALEAAITPNTVGFMVEPIQGEAGVIIPPNGYLREVKQICNQHNVTLIFDEIQTGLGRTGKLLADRHEDAEPDVTLIGKALAGGYYPVSAVLSNSEILGVLRPGEHGSTFGGNPLACAVADTALKVLVEENMVENSAAMGTYFIGGLRQISSPLIKEIRGRGLMIGLELKPEAGGARQYCERLKESGILCKDTHNDIIRISPPLVIRKDEIDWALERFDAVLTDSALLAG